MQIRIKARLEPEGIPVTVKGRDAWTLRQLLNAGSHGITSMTNPAPRLSGYVFKLRRAGFAIETKHEAHGGSFPGSHARYVLHSQPEILEDTTKGAQ